MARTDTIDKRAKKAKTSASAGQRKGKFAAAAFRMKKEAAAFWQKFNGEAMKFSLSFRLMIFCIGFGRCMGNCRLYLL